MVEGLEFVATDLVFRECDAFYRNAKAWRLPGDAHLFQHGLRRTHNAFCQQTRATSALFDTFCKDSDLIACGNVSPALHGLLIGKYKRVGVWIGDFDLDVENRHEGQRLAICRTNKTGLLFRKR